jgi:hypothetical protein
MPFAGSPENDLARAGHTSAEAWAGFFIIVKWPRPFYDRCIFGSMHVGARASAKVAKAAKMAAKPRPIASAE